MFFQFKLPIPLLCFRLKSPSQDAAGFLALSHIDGFYGYRIYFVEGFVQAGKIFFFGNQGGEPKTLHWVFGALENHLGDETQFAAIAP